MVEYRILFRESVHKDLRTIQKGDLQKILDCITSLAHNPRPSGCKKLIGEERYRVRQGNYRIVYSIQDDQLEIWVVKVGHRRDVYR